MKKRFLINLICTILILVIAIICAFLSIEKYNSLHKSSPKVDTSCKNKMCGRFTLDEQTCKCEKVKKECILAQKG